MARSKARVQALTRIAEHFGGTVMPGANPQAAYLVRRGRRIVLDVIAVGSIVPLPSSKPPRLRFDRGVLRLFERLRAGLDEAVTAGTTVVVTVTAPIRVWAKTAVEMVGRTRTLLVSRTAKAELAVEVHSNQIRIHILRGRPALVPKVVGFVHNRDSDPNPLFDLARVLLRALGAVTRADTARRGHRWLVLVIEDPATWIKTYGHVCSQLVADSDFERVVLVGPDGQVSTLDE